MRVDRWLRSTIGKIPQSLIEKNLRNGKIKVNKKKVKSSFKIKTNDKIQLFNFHFSERIINKKIKFEPTNEVIKENEDLIIDDNDDFIVLNKKSGVSVQGGTKSKKNLIDIFSKSEIFKGSKPYSVHRLDKETSGVFIMAKSRQSAQLLTSLFRLRKVYKTYLAICNGEIENNSGELNDELIRYDNGKKIIEKAKTTYKIIDKNFNSSLVEMNPITGRKHQLRKQLLNIGCPIIGDDKYFLNDRKRIKTKNLMLHAYKIKFMINNIQYNFKAKYNDIFEDFLKKNI